ncbi:GAP family protein [Curtobacterium sp. NPDC088465]|uniref:GAP family protein n=1 Tax=Curtobacterium sp. NPDC088465 TaxID=3363967 RepID=UPI003830C939
MDLLALAPGAVGIALSPLPVASVVVLLGHRRGSAPAVACTAGWTVAVAAALVLAVAVGERLPVQTAGGSSVQAIVAVVAGVVLAALAVWQWTVRRLPDGSPSSTRWADVVERVGPVHGFGLGMLLFCNPKAVVLALTAGLAFGDAEPELGEALLAGAAFVVVAASTTVLPVVLVLAAGRRARRPLAAMRAGIARWGSVGLVAVLAVLAVVQLTVGVVGLR